MSLPLLRWRIMKVQITYYDNESLSVEEVVRQATNNYGKNVMAITSTNNIVDLSGLTANNGNYFNFINYSGGQYNVITTGLLSNYLNSNTLLTPFYTTISGLDKWIAPSYYVAQTPENMIINIVTITPNTTMSLPFGGFTRLNINWGNGVSSTYSTIPIQYIYTSPGSYSISISGYATSFGNNATTYTGASLISTVTQWGQLGLTSLSGAFNGAGQIRYVPSTISQYITNVSYMFYNALAFNSNITNWNTINITNIN